MSGVQRVWGSSDAKRIDETHEAPHRHIHNGEVATRGRILNPRNRVVLGVLVPKVCADASQKARPEVIAWRRTVRTVSAVALHGGYRAVMGWPAPLWNPW